MEIYQVTIPYDSRSDVFHLYPVGDIHAAAKSCAEDVLDETIAEIAADPLARWIGMGDMAEYINFHDPRFDIAQVAPWVWKEMGRPFTKDERKDFGRTLAKVQRTWVEKKLAPIKGKCLGMLYGNHEDTLRLRYEDETAVALSDRLGVPALGYSCYLRLLFSRQAEQSRAQELVLFLHHGFFAGRMEGAIPLGLGRLLKEHTTARAIIVAHGHRIQPIEAVSHTINWKARDPEKQIVPVVRYAVMTGSFLRGYSYPGTPANYAEKKGLPSQVLGPAILQYQPDKDKLKVIS